MIDALVEKAQVALHKFLELDQEQVDHIVHEMAPVSYTHLDVYKRQEQNPHVKSVVRTKEKGILLCNISKCTEISFHFSLGREGLQPRRKLSCFQAVGQPVLAAGNGSLL